MPVIPWALRRHVAYTLLVLYGPCPKSAGLVDIYVYICIYIYIYKFYMSYTYTYIGLTHNRLFFFLPAAPLRANGIGGSRLARSPRAGPPPASLSSSAWEEEFSAPAWGAGPVPRRSIARSPSVSIYPSSGYPPDVYMYIYMYREIQRYRVVFNPIFIVIG